MEAGAVAARDIVSRRAKQRTRYRFKEKEMNWICSANSKSRITSFSHTFLANRLDQMKLGAEYTFVIIWLV